MRLDAQTAWFENGLVFLPRTAPWLAEYVTEVTGFPGTKYENRVDSTSSALSHCRGSPFLLAMAWA
jgi:predicted phage terminase large subunit-like protein